MQISCVMRNTLSDRIKKTMHKTFMFKQNFKQAEV